MSLVWILLLALAGAAATSSPTHAQWKPDWQKHCDQCIGYYTAKPDDVHCVGQYQTTYAECLTGGGRACLMSKAMAFAKSGDCERAFNLTLICQCHNGAAQDQLRAAGPRAVCGYLQSK